MKNKIITLAVVGATAVVLLGGRAVRSHLSTIRDEVKTAVRQATPDGFETKRIKALIASMSEEVLTFSDKITEVENSAAAQRKDIAQIEKRIAVDRADLLTERDFLAQTNQAFHIRGAAYTRAQVQASATARLARLQRDQATLVTKRQAIERLEAAAREGQKRLQEALAVRDAKLQELELLQAQLANAKLRRDLDALAAPLENGSLARSKSELAESMQAFADRVRHVERQTEAAAQVISTPALIHHDNAAQTGVLEQIDQFLRLPAEEAEDAR